MLYFFYSGVKLYVLLSTYLCLIFLAHLSYLLMVSYCVLWMSVVHCPLCVVCRQQLLQRTSPPKLLADCITKLGRNDPLWPSLIVIQMIMERCLSGSHWLRMDFLR